MTTSCAECLVETARSFVGVKWRHQGRVPWALDCLGHLVLTLRGCGFEVEDRSDYGRTPWQDGLREALMAHFGEPVTDRLPGDILLMQWPEHPEPSHVGIATPIGMVHSYSMTGVTEHGIDEVWAARIKDVFRPCR